MTDHVKPGQVWASKNSGKRIVITSPGERRHQWEWKELGAKAGNGAWIHEFLLVDDFVLVKEAP